MAGRAGSADELGQEDATVTGACTVAFAYQRQPSFGVGIGAAFSSAEVHWFGQRFLPSTLAVGQTALMHETVAELEAATFAIEAASVLLSDGCSHLRLLQCSADLIAVIERGADGDPVLAAIAARARLLIDTLPVTASLEPKGDPSNLMSSRLSGISPLIIKAKVEARQAMVTRRSRCELVPLPLPISLDWSRSSLTYPPAATAHYAAHAEPMPMARSSREAPPRCALPLRSCAPSEMPPQGPILTEPKHQPHSRVEPQRANQPQADPPSPLRERLLACNFEPAVPPAASQSVEHGGRSVEAAKIPLATVPPPNLAAEGVRPNPLKPSVATASRGWTCNSCTYVHEGQQATFLSCAMCNAVRPTAKRLKLSSGKSSGRNACRNAGKSVASSTAVDVTGGSSEPECADTLRCRPSDSNSGRNLVECAIAAERNLLPYEEEELLSQMRYEKQVLDEQQHIEQAATISGRASPLSRAASLTPCEAQAASPTGIASELDAGVPVISSVAPADALPGAQTIGALRPASVVPQPAPPTAQPPSVPLPPARSWCREDLDEWLSQPEQAHIRLDIDQRRVVDLACRQRRSIFYTGPGGVGEHRLSRRGRPCKPLLSRHAAQPFSSPR